MHTISDEELIREIQSRFAQNKKALDELQNLNEELLTVNRKLEDSEALKSHFLANIANEIRNPFASVLGFASSILSAKKRTWKEVLPMISHIYTEVFYLDFQFKNIFTAAKLEAGQVTPEIYEVDIKKLLHNLVVSFQHEAKKKNITILINNGVTRNKNSRFKTDPEKLKLILSNLLNNAIIFSHKDSKIDIKYTINNKYLQISVQDYGEGISPENQKIIFDRFKRADSGINSVNRGHGLGLSVNKALIEILNGDIEFETKINNGTVFNITLPEPDTGIIGTADNDNEALFSTYDDGVAF
jgi:signal transduction histidine kinase